MPKNVSFEGKKLERVNRGQISEKILQNTKHTKKMRNLKSGQERKKQFFRLKQLNSKESFVIYLQTNSLSKYCKG